MIYCSALCFYILHFVSVDSTMYTAFSLLNNQFIQNCLYLISKPRFNFRNLAIEQSVLRQFYQYNVFTPKSNLLKMSPMWPEMQKRRVTAVLDYF